MPFTKADQSTLILILDTLGMSVSVNCGNKIDFSFGANYADSSFARTVTYYT